MKLQKNTFFPTIRLAKTKNIVTSLFSWGGWSLLEAINPEYSLEGHKTEAPILWPSDVKNRLFGKNPDAGKDWRQKEKAAAEDEMAGWHHWLNGHEFEQAPGDGKGWGNLACCNPWGHKESDMTERLKTTNELVASLWRKIHHYLIRFQMHIPLTQQFCTWVFSL